MPLTLWLSRLLRRWLWFDRAAGWGIDWAAGAGCFFSSFLGGFHECHEVAVVLREELLSDLVNFFDDRVDVHGCTYAALNGARSEPEITACPFAASN